jgi:phage gp46-like protein
MPDIATIWNPATSAGDWGLNQVGVVYASGSIILDSSDQYLTDPQSSPITDSTNAVPQGSIIAGDDLRTAVLISLFTDREAETDDVIPDGTTDPRGWWAQAIGSRIWLLYRSKQTAETLRNARDYASEALQWLLDAGIAARIDVQTLYPRPGFLGWIINIYKTDGTKRTFQFDWAWQGVT